MMLRPKLNRIWANSSPALRRDPGDAKYLQGWISEIPTFQVLNYLQWKVDTTILANAERGIPEWGTDVQYRIGSLVWDDSTGFIYVATVEQPNRTTRPSANAGHWSKSSIQITRKEFDDVVTAITAHIANKSNPHNLTAGQLNAYNKSEMDALVTQYRTIVDNHARNKDNPHNTTAEKAGAVPATGGKYTGPVTFAKSIILNTDNTARLCNENGLYLEIGAQSDNVAVVGITSSGDVVAGRKNDKSKIVTEKTFQDLKADNEPDYAVPAPCFKSNFVFDINTQVGAIYWEGDGEELYDIEGGFIPTTQSGLIGNQGYPVVGRECTVTALFKVIKTPNSDESYPALVGSELFYLGLGYEAASKKYTAHFNTKNGLAFTAAIPAGTDLSAIRITASLTKVSSQEQASLYLNGVLLHKTAPTSTLGMTTLGLPVVRTGAGNPSRCVSVRDLVVWGSVLTDKQISTL